MATVTATKSKVVVVKDITVTLTTDEARLVAELLDRMDDEAVNARRANEWLYDLIEGLEKASL